MAGLIILPAGPVVDSAVNAGYRSAGFGAITKRFPCRRCRLIIALAAEASMRAVANPFRWGPRKSTPIEGESAIDRL